MDSRRRVLAVAATSVVAALAGCATGDGGTDVDDTASAAGATTGPTTGSLTTTKRDSTAAEPTTTEQPTTEQPTTEQPTTEQPTTEQPTTEQPTTEQPTTEQPTTEQPTTTEPTETSTRTVVTVGPSGDLRYGPDSVTLPVGSVVEFRWDSDGHNVVVADQPRDANWDGTSGNPNTTYDSGHTHAHTFEVSGRYEYYCAPHKGFGMDGTIVVE